MITSNPYEPSRIGSPRLRRAWTPSGRGPLSYRVGFERFAFGWKHALNSYTSCDLPVPASATIAATCHDCYRQNPLDDGNESRVRPFEGLQARTQ
jgi:hypothetical protein